MALLTLVFLGALTEYAVWMHNVRGVVGGVVGAVGVLVVARDGLREAR